jgi:hypothetical protein
LLRQLVGATALTGGKRVSFKKSGRSAFERQGIFYGCLFNDHRNRISRSRFRVIDPADSHQFSLLSPDGNTGRTAVDITAVLGRQGIHRRRQLICQAEDYVAHLTDQPLPIGQLCREINVSERTLRDAFL